jgi:hypothetical protein
LHAGRILYYLLSANEWYILLSTDQMLFELMPCTNALHQYFTHNVACQELKGERMSYRLNLELLVSTPVLQAVKEYEINIPELCINSLLSEIDRCNSIRATISSTTLSKDIEIRELKEALRIMREKLEKAETAAIPKSKLWHRQ